MPGLPEVEVIRRDLEREVVGRRIKDVEVRPGTNAMKIIRRHGRRKDFQDLLQGAKVEKVDRLGRRLLLDLDNANVLVVDLGQSGNLRKTSTSEGVETHTHLVIGFTIGGQLRLLDPKRTGEAFVVPRAEVDGSTELRDFKMDPLEHQLAWQQFSSMLEEQERSMKALLMDDDFICGLGAIYSDEVLFAAGIRPDRVSNNLTSQDVRRLYRALMETLQDAVKARGTTWAPDEFRDLQGNPGAFQLELKVYERDGEPCRRCRQEIVREKIGSTYAYLCPQCQS